MILHEIAIDRATNAWAWIYWYGGNGQIIGQNHGQYVHAVEIPRGTAPPIVAEADRAAWNYGRLYWDPWREPGGLPRDALCQTVRTRARHQYPYWGGNATTHHCPDCTLIAARRGIAVHTRHELVANDPWNNIPRDERMWAIDPVTGR